MLRDVEEGSQLILDSAIFSPTLWNFRGPFSFQKTKSTSEFEECIDGILENYRCRTTNRVKNECKQLFGYEMQVPVKLLDDYKYGLCLCEVEEKHGSFLNKKQADLAATTLYANLFEQPTSLLTYKSALVRSVQSLVVDFRSEGHIHLPPRIIAPNPYLIGRIHQDSYSRVVPATAHAH